MGEEPLDIVPRINEIRRNRVSSAPAPRRHSVARDAQHRHSILVVEDDLDSREALKEYLRLEGFRVAAADDGEAALETLRAGFTPCVILLDMKMPGVDGEAFQRERRRHTVLATVPVIVISGDERLSAAGCEAERVLVKPVDLRELRGAIAGACAAEQR